MGALPKKKPSKARTRKRRANFRTTLPTLVKCSNCDQEKLPHTVCQACGFYAGKQVITVSKP